MLNLRFLRFLEFVSHLFDLCRCAPKSVTDKSGGDVRTARYISARVTTVATEHSIIEHGKASSFSLAHPQTDLNLRLENYKN